MKQLFIITLLILIGCFSDKRNITTESKNITDLNEIEKKNEIKKIKDVLFTQQTYWNNGDIDGFMRGYWNSEQLIFTSAEHKPTYGWKNTLEMYKRNYPTRYSMGEFRFDILDVNLTSNTTADLNGKWELIRIADQPKGRFWLILKKFDENWLIIKDSTTSF
jgi:hypothetical protein